MVKSDKTKGSRGGRAREIQKLKKRLKKDPADESAFVQLWDIFAESESWEAAAELMRARSDVLTEPAAQLRALLRLGSLYDERLGDLPLAMKAYNQALALDADNRRALWALSVLYHDTEDWEGVIDVYLKRIRLAGSLEEKLSLRSQLAQIYEQRLQQEDRALIEYIRAARMAPQNLRILLHLESLAKRTESFRELLAVYEDVVERIESIDLRVALYLKLARLYAEHMDDAEQAEAYQRRALELAGDQVEMVFSLSTLYGEEGDWETLIDTYSQLIRLTDGDEKKSKLRREIARLHRRGLNDSTAAFYEMLRVARYNPSLPGLVADLFDLASESNHQLEIAAMSMELFTRLDNDPSRLDLLLRLGRMQLDELDDSAAAVTIARQALEVDAGNVMAWAMLVESLKLEGDDDALRLAIEEALALAHLPDDVAASMRVLIPPATAVQKPRKKPEDSQEPKDAQAVEDEDSKTAFEATLDSLLARKKESQDPESRANLAVEIAELLEKRMGQVDRAFFELLPAAKLAPDHSKLMDELFRLARLAGYTRELEAVVDDVLATLEPDLGASLHMRLGLLLEADGRPADAEARYRESMSLDATQTVAYQKLRSLAENLEDWSKVTELDLKRAAVLDTGSEKLELLLGAAGMFEKELKNPLRAHGAYERALKIDADHVEAKAGFDRLAPEVAASLDPIKAEVMQVTPGGLTRQPKAPAGATVPGFKLPGTKTPTKEPPPLPPVDDLAEIYSPPPSEDIAEIYSPPRVMDVEADALQKLAPGKIDNGEEEEEDRQSTDVGAKALKHAVDSAEEEEDERIPTLVTAPPKRTNAESRTREQAKKKARADAEATAAKEGQETALREARDQSSEKANTTARADATTKASRVASKEARALALGDALGKAIEYAKATAKDRAAEKAGPRAENSALADAQDLAKNSAEAESRELAERTALEAAKLAAAKEAADKGHKDATLEASVQAEAKEAETPAGEEQAQIIEDVDADLIEEIDEASIAGLEAEEAAVVAAPLEEKVEEIGEDDEVEEIAEDDFEPLDDGPTIVESKASPPQKAPTADTPETPVPEYESPLMEESDDENYDESFVEEKTSPGGPSGVEQQLWQAARSSAGDATAWEELAVHLETHDSAEAAFNALEEAASHMEEGEPRGKLFRRMSLLSQSVTLRARLSQLLEEQGHLDEAESSYRAVLRSEPGHVGALDGLFRIYEKRGSIERYDAILTRALGGLRDAGARRALLIRRAGLRADLLDRPRDALDDLEQLLLADDSDLDALAMREGILEKTERYDDLVKAYRAHLPYCMTPEEQVDLLVAIASLYENRLDNPQQAISFFRKALKQAPERLSSLESLVNLLERRRDWVRAIEALRLAGEAQTDPEAACRIHYRMGKILEEQLLRPDEAERAYRRAIHGDIPSADALVSLKGMARRRGDWVDVLRLGHMQVDQCDEPKKRAELLVELAKAWRERLDNEDKAYECYERALRDDPDNVEAAQVVAELRLKDHRHAEAHELLEQLAEHSERSDQDDATRAGIYLKLAQTAEALDKPERAGQAYVRALELAPADASVLSQYGYHLSRQGEWNKAIELYQEVLRSHAKILGKEELADLHCMLAQGFARQDSPEMAIDEYDRALQIDPKHLPALRASIELSRQLNRWPQVVALLGRYRQLSTSPAASQKVSLQIADLLANTLDDPSAAAVAYQEALDSEPNNTDILEKLRRVLVHAGRFSEAVDILKQLAHLASTEHQKARYLKIAGDILRERLDEDRKALDCYLSALDVAPLEKRCHASAVKILNRLRDWPRLAKLYEEQLHRLPPPIGGANDHRVAILGELVELYRYRLDDRPKAVAACEQLLKLVPGDLKIREDLARLYEAEQKFDDAIRTHRELIAASPFSIDSYHALLRIYENRGEHDRTLCMAATLNFLDEATADEACLLKANRHAMPLPSGRRMTEEAYNRHLLHGDAGGLLGDLFSFAADHARSVFLGLPAPEIYSKGLSIKGILAINTSPVAVLYSEEAVRRANIQELRFMTARALAFTRPENLLASSLSPRQLRLLLDALVDLAMPARPLDPGPEVGALVKRLNKAIPRNKRHRLKQLAERIIEHPEELSIRNWLEGVEHTCNRAGFILCGDLEASVKVLKGARVVSPSGSNRSLIRELIFFSISDAYFELRRVLDAAV
ncbi:MAG: tetratricopeptide repeat protein [Deltaproteobacteria bacterium]|nr:tetratricopeptide repeat protein [Deltaproteobacteria bacterium]